MLTTINAGSTLSYNHTGLSTLYKYNYAIIPFTWDGTNNATINYYTTSAATANATTTTSIPWSENFDAMSSLGASILPTAWLAVNNGYAFTSTTGSDGYHSASSTPNYVEIAYGNSTLSYLWTPGFALTAGSTYKFTFKYAGDGYAGYTGNYYVNTAQSASGANFSQLGTFIAAATTSSTSYTTYTFNYTPAANAVYYFSVGVSSSFVPYSGLGFDDFTLVGPCAAPTSLATAGTPSPSSTVNSVTASFVAAASAPTGYVVVRTTTNVQPTPVTGTPYSTGSNAIGYIDYSGTTAGSFTSTGLSANTTYYYWVFS